MIRKNLVRRVIGRRLLEALVRSGWVTPVKDAEGWDVFDEYAVSRALRKLARGEGWQLRQRYVQRAKKERTDSLEHLSLEGLENELIPDAQNHRNNVSFS